MLRRAAGLLVLAGGVAAPNGSVKGGEKCSNAGDNGAVFQAAAGDLGLGGLVMIAGRAAEIVGVTAAKAGAKQGKGKVRFQAIDLFSSAQRDETKAQAHLVDWPYMNYECFQVLETDAETGAVKLLSVNGQLRDDRRLPGHGVDGQLEEDVQITANILEAQARGAMVGVTALALSGSGKIVATRIDEYEEQKVLEDVIAAGDESFLGNLCATTGELEGGLLVGEGKSTLAEHLLQAAASSEA